MALLRQKLVGASVPKYLATLILSTSCILPSLLNLTGKKNNKTNIFHLAKTTSTFEAINFVTPFLYEKEFWSKEFLILRKGI